MLTFAFFNLCLTSHIQAMRRIHNLLHLPLIAAIGADAFDTSIFKFDSYREPSIPKDAAVADAAVRRLVELRVAPPDVPTLGAADEETVELLNHFGGAQLPLFGGIPANEGQKTTIVLEGIAPETGSFRLFFARFLFQF